MYSPEEDSFLLSKVISNYLIKNKISSFLDMGCGSGIQSKTAIESKVKKEHILAVDIDQDSLKETEKLGVKTLNSNLFENIESKFDLIAFNAPYLPEDKLEKGIDTTGGKKGWEIINKFINQAKNHLTEKGVIFLLFSSLTNKEKVEEIIKNNKLSYNQIESKKLFMEELFVYKIIKN